MASWAVSPGREKTLQDNCLSSLKQARDLERERAAANEQLTRAILRERISSEEERSKAKHLARQLEEKDRLIRKQDAFYKEQLARLEERSSEFYKVTTEEYQKAAEEVEAKFKRYEYHPVCADLQTKILQCYRQNTQQTLSCSALASQYMHCVNHAKQVSLRRDIYHPQIQVETVRENENSNSKMNIDRLLKRTRRT
ncbi:MICOS complex subunit MIC19 isoform X3 [Peromyscus eremicus]|uniref:MICOS complex subunit MIC19 isoform X3 n=1 Tax=Peromyscus eremicus TaxID=42410 RepID=UPI0027DBCEAF|nr:MICOS complex subunit MIC19 isoform X3 [Peromyscus eremicus]